MRRTLAERMRFSRGTKLFLLTVTSFCALSLWSSLREPKPHSSSLLSIEGYSINRKSLAIPPGDAAGIGGHNKAEGVIKHRQENITGNSRIIGGIRQHVPLDNNNNNNNNNYGGNKAENHLPPPPRPSTGGQVRTILMSYMRSGSTFTGDLFQASPDVMYMYEPLLYTNDVDELPQNTPIRSRLIYKFVKDAHPPETLDYSLDTMKCNLTAPNLKYMIGYTYSRSFDDYAKCIKGSPSFSEPSSACSQVVMKRCQQSRNVISKILRLKMWEVDDLLTRDPELQIIHLVRDPRGITMSRNVARYYLNVRTLCARMNKDAALSIDLQKKYPGRILTVRYEDLATSAMNMTRKLFHHAGVPWTPQIAEKVRDLTSPSNNSFDEKIFGTKRKNSATTAFNWRKNLPFKTAEEIQKQCREMMELYGYTSFALHSEMLNLEFPSLKFNYTDKYYKGEDIPLPEL